MPNEESINEIVSSKAISQVEIDLVKALEKSNQALQDNIKSVKTLNDAIANSKGFAAYNANTQKAAILQERQNKLTVERQIKETQLGNLLARNAAKELADQQKLQALREKRRKTIISDSAAEVAAYEKSKQGIDGVTNTVNKLNIAEAKAASSATALTAATKTTNVALKETEEITEKVSSGFGTKLANGANKAFGFVRQLAYILPGVGIAGLLGFATEPILKYISTLNLFKKTIDQILETRKQVNDVNLKGGQNAQLEIAQLKTLYSVATDVNRSQSERYKYVKQLQQQYPETFKNFSLEDIALGKAFKGYTNLAESILATARARASQDKIAENSSRQLGDEQIVVDERVNNERIKNAIKNQEALRNISRNAPIKNAQAAQGEETANAQTIKSLKKEQAESDKIITDATRDRNILETRNLALLKNINTQLDKGAELTDLNDPKSPKTKKVKDNSLEQIRKDSIEIINNEKATLEERYGALESFLNASNQLYKKNEGERNKAILDGKNFEKKIIEDANKAILVEFTADEKARVQLLQDSNNGELEIIESKRSAVKLALDNQYADGIINKEQYDAKIYQLDKKAALDSIALQLDTIDQIIEIQRQDLFNGVGSQEELSANEKKQSQLRIQYSKIETDAKIKNRDEAVKAAEKELEAIKQLTQKSLEFGKALIDGIYTRRLNGLANESAALDKKKQQDIENVNDSILTEQQKADQIAIINARSEAKQTEIDERIRQQKIKQAKADKAQAIAQIIIQTALAQIKVIGQAGLLGFVFSPLITALGALSLATVLATPIPQFEKGGTVKNDGMIITGEAGTELRIDPSGKQSLTDSSANLSYAKAGTKIIPNHELIKMMAKPDSKQFVGGQSVDISKLVEEQRNTTSVLKKAFGDKPVNSTLITKHGWYSREQKMSSIKKHIGRNFG